MRGKRKGTEAGRSFSTLAAAPSPLPEGWKWTTIDSLSTLITKGSSPGWQGFTYVENGVPFLRSQNVRWGSLDVSEMVYLPEEFNASHGRSVIKEEDVLLNLVGALIGRSAVATREIAGANTNQAVGIIRVNPDVVYNRYLMYYLISPSCQGHIAGTKADVVRANFNLDDIRPTPVPLGALVEQRNIVAEIEKQFTRLDAAVASLKRAQANLKRYRASVLKAACEGRLVSTEAELARAEGRDYEPADRLLERILGDRRSKWEVEQLSKTKINGKRSTSHTRVCRYNQPASPDFSPLKDLPEGWCWATVDSISTKVVDGVHQKPSYVPSGIPFVTVRNLTAGPEISFEHLNYVTESDHQEFTKRANPQKGDILVSKDGTLGVIRVVNTERPFSIFVSVAMIKPVDYKMSSYLGLALSSPAVQAQMVPKGSGLQHIHLEDLRLDCLAIPPPCRTTPHRR